MNNKYKYLIIAFLIVASFIAFGRILANDFVNYDDNRLITENSHIKTGFNAESIKWAFTNSSVEYWHPLTWLSIMLDWRLFGANASGHHFVSLLLHIGSAILLFLFLSKATGALWPSAFAAALFALHPLRVESVAWAAERKDVLSVFFGMATLYAYAYYVEKPQISKYFICLILFVLSLMSKLTLVTLPCVLLLLDYWPLGRWQKASTPDSVPVLVDKGTGKKKSIKLKAESSVDKKIAKPVQSGRQLIGNLLWEKVPFFFLALSLGSMGIWQAQKDRLFVTLQQNPFFDRIMNAIVSYVSYLGKTFWPIDLAVFYPYPDAPPLWQFLGALLIFLLISVVIILYIRKLPFLFVGWFWYLGVLFPVIGLMQAGLQTMADRYTYFPSIGIAIMLTWGVGYLLPKVKLRKIIIIPTAIILAALTFLTWQQCGYWKNSISLFNHVLQATKDNYLAHLGLGTALAAEGKNEEAIHHYRESIEINPYLSNTHLNLAHALVIQGRIEEAIAQYLAVIKLNPDQEEAHSDLGVVLATQGKKLADQGKKSAARRMNEEAIAHYLAAIKINPNYDNAYYNLANLYIKQGKIAEAIDNYVQAIKINPDHFDAHFNLADIFVQQSKIDQAIEHFREAVRINPSSFKALNNLGVYLEKQLKHDEAIYYYRQALQLEPNNPGIYFNLGVAQGNKGEVKEAIENFRQAVFLKPDFEAARRALRLAQEIEKR